ncbi:MAG: sulfotransferase [Proteobacteria bacterium]|nr:sulfotransferase [Pseudomonadota bacterium]MDA0914034.1 sulfotransferase [Pseudomonadota bacterium]MDA1033080.1 sulfotransferase [Pseudomonadota bacterium]
MAQQAVRADATAIEAVLVMAAIAVEHGNTPGAEKLCILAAKSGHSSCWLAVLEARIALLHQDQEKARDCALVAHSLGTQDPHIANQLGVVLSRTGRHAEAVEPFRTAVIGVDENAEYRYNLAVALQFAGKLDEAEEEFCKLVKQAPDHASGWLALVQIAKTPDEAWASKLEQQFNAAGSTDNKLLFGHALARLAETREAWDTSFSWLEKAKADKKREVSHDRSEVERIVGAATRACTTADVAVDTVGDERPLFIVGMPRSGTTLVERILTSHSAVTSVGELSDFAIVLKRALDTPGQKVLDPAVLNAAAKMVSLHEVGASYVHRAEALAGDAERFIDKMPFNFYYVPAILRALPGARVICLRRSPYDVVFANYRQLFATGFSYYSYAYDIGDTAHFVAQFELLAQAYEDCLPSSRFLTIRYEDIISDQRSKTEQLLAFCGLGWEDACMDFHQNTEPVATASSLQVRRPLYSSSIDQWRRYGPASRIAKHELEKFGLHKRDYGL